LTYIALVIRTNYAFGFEYYLKPKYIFSVQSRHVENETTINIGHD